MAVTLEEMKQYLRVDFEDDDLLLASFIAAAEKLCMDVARCEDAEAFAQEKNAKIAVMYAVAYWYGIGKRRITRSLRYPFGRCCLGSERRRSDGYCSDECQDYFSEV